jgi:predicted nucleotidyltransferase
MAKIPNKIKKMIADYLKALQDNNIPIKRAVLFGSYVRGNYTEFSDIDLAIVSDIFEGTRFENKNKIRHITISFGSNIEVLPYSPQDFTPEDPFVKEILETGIPIV